MYGLLLEVVADVIREKFGENAWDEVKHKAEIPHVNFVRHQVYSETYMFRICKACSELLQMSRDDLMYMLGEAFVHRITKKGYSDILKILGRNVRDFVNGLDNLHEYLQFSYPKLRAPSFIVTEEDFNGITLQYKSRRRGFTNYVKGQLEAVCMEFYSTQVLIEVRSENMIGEMTCIEYRMTFDNSHMSHFVADRPKSSLNKNLYVSSSVFFHLFPFNVVFNENMAVLSLGASLKTIMDECTGRAIDEVFTIKKPPISFTYSNVLNHLNNVFELVTIENVGPNRDEIEESSNTLTLRGQMLLMEEWSAIVFLASPLINNLDEMAKSGLFINDLSMHDSSRELVLAGTQQSVELKLALDQEEQKTKLLADNLKKLDKEVKKTDQLLYQMIPKTVAQQLRRGISPVDTCKLYDCVSIVFTDIKGFTNICSGVQPIEVVKMLNTMYTLFDRLSDQYQIYKVETIGDAYMGVGGCPNESESHAESAVNIALNMILAASLIRTPKGDSVQIRAGVHSGPVVAGVVGLTMPRYCLFGKTVQIANLMESSGEPDKTQISEQTRKLLKASDYIFEKRPETIQHAGEEITTYFVRSSAADKDRKAKQTSALQKLVKDVQTDADFTLAA